MARLRLTVDIQPRQAQATREENLSQIQTRMETRRVILTHKENQTQIQIVIQTKKVSQHQLESM